MKKQALTVLSIGSLLVMLAVVPLYAISSKITANIPFDFMVGNKTLPAGSYRVGRSTTMGMLVILSLDQRGSAMFHAHPVRYGNPRSAKWGQDNSPKLIFNRYGDQYFLSQVWSGEETDDGRRLMKSRREREVAKENLAKNASEPEVVFIAAL